MKSSFTIKKGVKKTSLTLFGLLMGAQIGLAQETRSDVDFQENISLKYRSTVDESERIYADSPRENNYLILHFDEELPSPEELAGAGIHSLHFMNNSTIYAHISASTNLADITSFSWAMELQPRDKKHINLDLIYSRLETVPVLIYLPADLSSLSITSFVEEMGLSLITSPALPPHVLIADITEAEMQTISEHAWVSWISPVPPLALTGENFHFCLGSSTPYGHQAEFAIPAKYVLQGSDWDGPGLGCADLTYHFENGTPDLSGTSEENIVENAMAEWVLHAGLTFTETPTVGLANSIDISWASGDHGDGNSFDGPSGTLAHAYYPQYGGELHFDEAETWTTGGGGIDLFAVAVHELGHALGLAHSDNGSAVMAPYYAGAITELHSDDIAGIQALYSSTPCGAGSYCTSSGTNSSFEWIESIDIDGNTNTSGNNSGYGDFTGDTPIALTTGSTVSVSLTPDFSGTTYSEFWNIWIDYDNNNTFDASELVFSGTGTSAVSGSFTVPSGLTGTTRMRISMKWNSDATPCETFPYGEVEDYMVSFAAAPVVYCASSGNNSSYEWISGVSIGGGLHSSGDDGGYGDYTGVSYGLTTGSYAVELTPAFSGTSYTEYWKIWIDLNHNGVFEGSEELFSGSGSSMVSGSMAIPSGYAGTTTRMRVTMKYDSAPTSCEAFSWGEVQDYTVNISPASIVADTKEGALSYQLYPNPTTDILNIISGQGNTQYELFDPTGRLVESGLITDQKLDVSGLAPGQYMIRLSEDNRVEVMQFVRQ